MSELKTNITTGISMMNYPYRDMFLTAYACISRNRGSHWEPYSSITVRDREAAVSGIERPHPDLSNNEIKTKFQIQNCFENHIPICILEK